jgi:hypothetical protein
MSYTSIPIAFCVVSTNVLRREIGTSCNDYLLNCISNGTVEIGNKEVKKLEKEFVKEG